MKNKMKPDQNCFSLKNGECIGKDCMHDVSKSTHTFMPLKINERGSCIMGIDVDGEDIRILDIPDHEDMFQKEAAAFIVRAVNAHEELVERLKEMSSSFHHNGRHGGYLTDCDSDVCVYNLKAIAKAEGK